MEVFVGNIGFGTSPDQVKAHVQSTVSGPQPKIDAGRGFAVLKYTTPALGEAAIAALSSSKLDGRALIARKSAPRASRVDPNPQNGQRNGAPQNGQRNDSKNDSKGSNGALLGNGATVFVSGLAKNTSEKLLRQYFSASGDVTSVEILTDRATGGSRGAAFVSFKSPSSAKEVLSGKHVILGSTVNIQPRAVEISDAGLVHVRGAKTLSEKAIRDAFSRFGSILSIRMINRSYGFALVHFASLSSAERACEVMHDKEMQGHDGRLTVRLSNNQTLRKPATKATADASIEQKAGTLAAAATKDNRERGGNAVQAVRNGGLEIESEDKQIVNYFDQMVKAGHNNKSGKKLQGSLTVLLESLNRGGQTIGDARAMLLHKWYILLQNDDRKGAHRFVDDSGVELKFRQVFAQSNVLESLCLGAFDSPLGSEISSQALLPACKLSVTTLMCKVMQKTIKGGEDVHLNLLAILEGLIRLKIQNPRLRQSFSQLVGCFKANTNTHNPHFHTQIKDMTAQINVLEASMNMPPEMLIARYQEMWGLIADQVGLGVSGQVGRVVAQLQADLRALVSEHDTTQSRCKDEVMDITSEISKLQGSQKQANDNVNVGIKVVKERMQNLNSQRAVLKSDLLSLVGEQDKLQASIKQLEAQKRTMNKVNIPKARDIEKRRSESLEMRKAEEQSQSALDQVGALLDSAHRFLCPKDDSKLSDNAIGSLVADTHVSPAIATRPGAAAGPIESRGINSAEHDLSPHLNELAHYLDEAKKLRARRLFCKTKLSNMEVERGEMMALEFLDVADDLSRGMGRMSTELQTIIQTMQDVEQKASGIYSWLSGVKANGIGSRQSATEAAQTYQAILAQMEF